MAGRKREATLFGTLDPPPDAKPPPELAEWWHQQRVATAAHVEKLAEVFNRNLARAEEERWADADDRWDRVWLLDARLRYADLTLQLLDRRGQRPMACPTCGLKGIEGAPAWQPLVADNLVWLRWCETHAMDGPITKQAEQLAKNWRRER